MSNTQYAEDVKNVLNTNINTKVVGFIYKNDNATVSQNVSKNLYNTKTGDPGQHLISVEPTTETEEDRPTDTV